MLSEINLADNIYDIFETDETIENLFETSKMVDYFERMPSTMPVSEREYMGIFFRADNERRLYKREGYDVLTYLGDLGGLLDVVLVLGFLFTSFFASRLFKAALIGQVYRIQRYNKDFSQFYETKEVGKLTTESEFTSSEDEFKSNP